MQFEVPAEKTFVTCKPCTATGARFFGFIFVFSEIGSQKIRFKITASQRQKDFLTSKSPLKTS